METSKFTLQIKLPEFWRKIKDYSKSHVYYLDEMKPNTFKIVLDYVQTGRPSFNHLEFDTLDALYEAATTLEVPKLKCVLTKIDRRNRHDF